MDISGISTSVSANSDGRSASAIADSRRPEQAGTVEQSRQQYMPGRKRPAGSGVGYVRQELQLALRTRFRAQFPAALPSYAAFQQAATSESVANEVLGVARQVVAESPMTAAESLISFRAKVHETATYVRETLGSQGDDVGEVDDVVTRVAEGLEQIETEATNNRESSASVLAVDTRSKQRSTIQIRTQEGDVVRFSLKRVDSMSASDVAYTDGDMSITSTEIAMSSRSRMMMSVEGDLNETELAAIQNVFAKAEMIANEFFGGDVGAAFNIAQGFEFDTEQLARVNLQFRMRQISNVAYAASARVAPLPAPEASPLTGPEKPVVTVAEVRGAPEPAPVVAPEQPIVTLPDVREVPKPYTQPVIKDPAAETQSVEQAVPADAVTPLEPSALENFLDSLSAFLRSVGEGFAARADETAFTYHFSESFKLEMLKAVFHTVAPGELTHAADNAATVIDSLSETVDESA